MITEIAHDSSGLVIGLFDDEGANSSLNFINDNVMGINCCSNYN